MPRPSTNRETLTNAFQNRQEKLSRRDKKKPSGSDLDFLALNGGTNTRSDLGYLLRDGIHLGIVMRGIVME